MGARLVGKSTCDGTAAIGLLINVSRVNIKRHCGFDINNLKQLGNCRVIYAVGNCPQAYYE